MHQSKLLQSLVNEAHNYAVDVWGKQRTGETVYDPIIFERKLAELVQAECVRECRAIERMYSSNLSYFDRDPRSGRQVGASMCVERLRDLFKE